MKYQVLFIAVLLIMAALIAGCTRERLRSSRQRRHLRA